MILVLVAAFLVLLFAGIPIAYILGLVALLGISQLNSISLYYRWISGYHAPA